MNDLGIIEAADDLENGIDSADMRQEGVSESGTGGSAPGQTSDIVDRQVGRYSGLGLVLLAQPVVALVGDDDASLLGLNGSVREVLF